MKFWDGSIEITRCGAGVNFRRPFTPKHERTGWGRPNWLCPLAGEILGTPLRGSNQIFIFRNKNCHVSALRKKATRKKKQWLYYVILMKIVLPLKCMKKYTAKLIEKSVVVCKSTALTATCYWPPIHCLKVCIRANSFQPKPFAVGGRLQERFVLPPLLFITFVWIGETVSAVLTWQARCQVLNFGGAQ